MVTIETDSYLCTACNRMVVGAGDGCPECGAGYMDDPEPQDVDPGGVPDGADVGHGERGHVYGRTEQEREAERKFATLFRALTKEEEAEIAAGLGLDVEE